MTATLLEVRGLEHRFHVPKGVVHAVRGVDFDLGAGETLALVGESGSGKSTTARAVLRLIQPTAGSVRLEGRDLLTVGRRELRGLRRRVQMVFQDPYSSLDPKMTALEAVAEPLALHRVGDRSARRARALELLDLVGVGADRATLRPGDLSGGQRQRIAIARALALEPAVLVCDEAVSALDVSVQAQVLNLLADIQESMDVSLLFITHDLAVVSEIADRVAVMYLGRIVEIGPLEQLLRRPRHPYTVALLAAAPHLTGDRSGPVLQGEPPSPLNPPRGCSFASRCPRAEPVCREIDPVIPVADTRSHAFACHNPEPL